MMGSSDEEDEGVKSDENKDE
jgi:hypothetical protein